MLIRSEDKTFKICKNSSLQRFPVNWSDHDDRLFLGNDWPWKTVSIISS